MYLSPFKTEVEDAIDLFNVTWGCENSISSIISLGRA